MRCPGTSIVLGPPTVAIIDEDGTCEDNPRGRRFLKPLKETYPRDYARIVEFFPLVEMELLRYEARQALYD